jgi:3-(methylthio)propionyl---CoA ligase
LAQYIKKHDRAKKPNRQGGTMLGLMQDQPLLISSLIEFADKHHGDGEVVSRRVEGDIHRYTWSDVARRSRQVANALDGMKLGFGDRVATIAWNGYRHLELYFGVSGSGRVLHTINPRLHPEQIAWIANHAEDQVLCFDMTFLPIVQAVHSKCTTVKHWVAMCDADKLPADTGIPNLISYEAWMGKQSTLTHGLCLTKTPHPACATPVAPQATPRRPCTATAPPLCTLTPLRCPM